LLPRSYGSPERLQGRSFHPDYAGLLVATLTFNDSGSYWARNKCFHPDYAGLSVATMSESQNWHMASGHLVSIPTTRDCLLLRLRFSQRVLVSQDWFPSRLRGIVYCYSQMVCCILSG